MANICDSVLIFASRDEKELNALYDKLYNLFVGDGYSLNLGKILVEYNIEPDTVKCRGDIYYISEVDECDIFYTFEINVESAWTCCAHMWELILYKYYPEVEFCVASAEPGCEYFIRTNCDLVNTDDYSYYADWGTELDSFCNFYQSIDAIVKDVGDNPEYLNIYKIEVVSISDLD